MENPPVLSSAHILRLFQCKRIVRGRILVVCSIARTAPEKKLQKQGNGVQKNGKRGLQILTFYSENQRRKPGKRIKSGLLEYRQICLSEEFPLY